MIIFDTIIIGSGPCSEPAIYHLSKTNLNCLIVDADNINKDDIDIFKPNKLKLNNHITPKQRLKSFNWIKKNLYHKLNDFFYIKCINFIYVYSLLSGGLSNSWGGGVFEWPVHELIKTSSIPVNNIKKSYKSLGDRLCIRKRQTFSKISSSGKNIYKKINKLIEFDITTFLLNQNYKKEDKNKPFNQNLIWNSKKTIRNYLNNSKNLEYKKNTTVISFSRINKNFWSVCCIDKNKKIIFFKTKSIILCSGAINSACLVATGTNLQKAEFLLKHNNAYAIPIFNLKNNVKALSEINLDLPELSWFEKIPSKTKNNSFSSGYYINSLFLIKESIAKFPILKKRIIKNMIYLIYSRIGLFTIFLPSTLANVKLKVKIIESCKNTKSIYATISNESNQKDISIYTKKILNKLKLAIPQNIYLISLLKRYVEPGGDIHYASTLPEGIEDKSKFSTTSIGEVRNLPMVFALDSSRLAYLSTLPHTFTTMALNDASMPKIIKKIKKINA